MTTITEATDATFAREVLNRPGPVVVDFWADWCGPCKQLGPIVEELARQYEGQIHFVKVDTNEATATAAQQDVRMLPTIHLYTDGHLVNSLVGSVTKMKLRAALEDLVAA